MRKGEWTIVNILDNWIEWSDEFDTDYHHIKLPGELVLIKKDFTEFIAGSYCFAREHFIVRDKLTLDVVSIDEIKQFYHMITGSSEQLTMF